MILNNFNNDGKNFIDEVTLTSGQKIFNSLSNSKMNNAVKTENMFYVHFNINENVNSIISSRNTLSNYLAQSSGQYENIVDGSQIKELSWELSKLVKSIDKPTIKYTTKQLNEYNRKRIILEKREYDPINITFYDTKNNPVEEFFFNYLKIIDNTFLNKNSRNYQSQIKTGFDDMPNTWGLNINSNFKLIDSISIIEMCIDKVMVFTLENPVITNIKFGTNTAGSYKANEISLTFDYEGITNNLLVGEMGTPTTPHNGTQLNGMSYQNMINSGINESLAYFIQKSFSYKYPIYNQSPNETIISNQYLNKINQQIETTKNLISQFNTPNKNNNGKLVYNIINNNFFSPTGYKNNGYQVGDTITTDLLNLFG